jgi:hypothetical protein
LVGWVIVRGEVDPDREKGRMTFYSPVDFVASGACDANGIVRLDGFPALPWIVTASPYQSPR